MKILAYIRMKLAKPFQGEHLHAAGSSVVISSKVVTKTLGAFSLIPPDPVSLSLNDAQNFIDKALKLKERIVLKKGNATVTSQKYTPEELRALGVKSVDDVLKIDPEAEVVQQIDTDKMYSFIQAGADAMTSLITAVESFANVMIPRDHTEKFIRRKIEIEYDKDQMVRYLRIEDKLEIIGRILSKTDFKGKSYWESFLNIKKLRDDFIHFKQAHAHINEIWNVLVVGLIDSDLQKFYDDTVALIKYLRPEYFD